MSRIAVRIILKLGLYKLKHSLVGKRQERGKLASFVFGSLKISNIVCKNGFHVDVSICINVIVNRRRNKVRNLGNSRKSIYRNVAAANRK